MSFFLGIDLGTSYFKVGLFDEKGRQHGLGRQPLIKNSCGSMCEVELAVFWKTLCACIKQAISEAHITFKEIDALSYSSQANSFVLLDKSDKPLTPLILWSDERVTELPESITKLIGNKDFLYRTGQGIKPGVQSMIAKIDWIQKMDPDLWKKTRHILSISDYLVYSLTGKKIGDLSTSSMTGLLDIKNHIWWKEALDVFGIAQEDLSIPVKIGTEIGKLTTKGAELIGLSPGINMFAGGLDHHMVAVGAGLTHLNYISESTGTVLACVNYASGYHPRRDVNIAPGLGNDQYFQMAFNSNGATALEWYQQNFVPDYSISELLELAEAVEPGCEGLTAKPSADKFEWPGGFNNIGEKHSHAHFVRAILESTSLSLSEIVNVVDPENMVTAIIPSGGGSQSRLWLQIKANLTNKLFLLPESGELACKGAALLCGVGTSCYNSMEEAIEHQVRTKEVIKPDPVVSEQYRMWYHKINNSRI